MFTFEFKPLGHQLDHDGGAAHGHDATENKSSLPAALPMRGRQHAQKDGARRGQPHGE